MNRLRRWEPVAGVGGLLLLVSLFLNWYDIGFETPDTTDFSVALEQESTSAWSSFTVIDVILALIAVVTIAVPVTSAFARGPAKPIGTAVVAATISPLAVLLVLFRILVPPEDPIEAFGTTISLEPGIGAWLSLAGALIAVVGAWLSLRDESTPGAAPPDVPHRPAPAA